jgi:hypothetical protein
LRGRIQCWREVQLAYTPCVAALLAASISTGPIDEADIVSEHAESLPLHLPSSLPLQLRQGADMSTISDKERRLRMAQADDALAEIRRHRRIVTGLYQFKKLNVSGTGNRPNTRMWALFTRFNHKITRYAEKYRAAHGALTRLDPNGDWCDRLRPLGPNDVRGPGKDTNESHSRYEPSWIWLVPRITTAPDMGGSEEQLDNSMEVEWAKSMARRDRWEEEVPLIVEEMRRVITFHKWKAWWWKKRGVWRKEGSAQILHGVKAYAEKQAAFSEQLAQSSANHWYPALAEKGISPEWVAEYISLPLQEKESATMVGNMESDEWDDEEEVDDDFEDDEQDPDADRDMIDFFEDDD